MPLLHRRRATPVPPEPDAAPLAGAVPIAEVGARRRVCVAGRVRSLRIQPWGDAPALVATVTDGTGRIDVVFLGRRHVPGVTLGSRLAVRGMVGVHHGRLAVLDPDYDLLPPPPQA
jgi:hypothetical protein